MGDPMLLTWICAGVAGAFVRLCLMENGRLVFFRTGRTADGRKYLDLGFVSNLVVGVGCAVAVDHSWLTAFLGAVAGPEVIEQAVAKWSALRNGKG